MIHTLPCERLSALSDSPLLSLPPLPTSEEMRGWDRAAVAMGVPETVLMENASREACAVLRQCRGDLRGQRVLLFMGSGNNGGDAACLARHLLDAGALPLVLHTRPLARCRGVTARHVRLSRTCGVPFALLPQRDGRRDASPPCWERVAGSEWRCPSILVDGLLGTGFAGALRDSLAGLITQINACREQTFILALDVPSGLDADAGRPCPTAVRAHATVTFQAAKPGLCLPEAREFTGALHIRNIGIPLRVRQAHAPSFRLLDRSCALLFPPAPPSAYKNAFGHVLILGGAPGLTGAAHLAARAALRIGAGLVSAAAPGGVGAEIKNGLPDIMTLSLGDGSDWPTRLPENVAELARRCAALAVGPGLGRTPRAAAFPELLLALPQRPPTVWDADALHALGGAPELLGQLSSEDVLTPHPGEAARLLGIDARAVQEDRVGALRELASRTPALCVLKGAGTLLLRHGGPIGLSSYDVPNLAVAGSGDVLAGCLAGLLAQGADAASAAALAVALHAEAGRELARNYPCRGNTAGQIADMLPAAVALLRDAARPEIRS